MDYISKLELEWFLGTFASQKKTKKNLPDSNFSQFNFMNIVY